MTDTIFVAAISSVIVAAVALLIHRYLTNALHLKLQEYLAQVNEAERQVHIRQLEFLDEKNKIEVAHTDVVKQARAISFEEGRKQGKAEHELEASIQLADQRNEFAIRLQTEREQAATEARDKQRAENELQAKLFSVKISPYVQFLTDKGVIYDDYESKTGYQYQLLVNGIPAFQPHVVVERHEKIKKIDEAVKNECLKLARRCAEAAVTTYLGANPQFAKLAPEVIEEGEM